MGAVLVCFGNHDQDQDFSESRQRRERTTSEDSLLDRLQTNWSCGRLDREQDEDEDPINWDSFLLQSTKSTASSGSRMLSTFYSRLLEENDDCAFYVDCRGKRIKGAYLDQLELLEDYFLPCGRKRCMHLPPPPIEALEMYSSSEDCFSTSSTMMSDVDYWAPPEHPYPSEERRYLPPRPAFNRCSSFSPPVSNELQSNLKIHRAFTSPYLLEDACFAHFQSPRSSPSSKMDINQFPSPKAYLPNGAMGMAAMTAS